MVVHKNHNPEIKLVTFLLTSVCLSATALILPSVYANESIVDVITIEVPSSCSMSATGNTSHNATVQNGATVSDIGTTNIKVICNDNSGYAIYAIGYTDDTYGKTVLTSSTLGSTHDIITSSTVTTGTSSWAMKLTSQTGTYAPTIVTDFASYHAVPQEYTKVAYLTSSTDTGTTATGSNLTTTYRTYISQTQPAGTYVGQVKYTLVHPNMNDDSNKPVTPLAATDCPANSICYAPNASDIVGSMDSINVAKITSSPTAGKQTQTVASGPEKVDITSNSKTLLIAPNYSRPGYGFAGWSTDFEATNSSTIYGPNETITVPDVSSYGLILYPVWIASEGNLQGWSGCSSLTTAPTSTRATLASMTALKDTRDNNVYAVARLADGKCWMVENLRLDNTATITTANTHSPLNTNGNVTLKIDYANNTTANHLAASNNTWCTDYDAACYDQTILNTNNTNRSLTASYSSTGNSTYYQWYGYGNYYNWYSATAGNGTYSFSTNNNSVNGDLCPAGWHLPKGGNKNNSTNSEFWALAVTSIGTEPANTSSETYPYYTGSTEGANASKVFRQFPNNFVYSGDFDGSSNPRNNSGFYWSSSANSSYDAYSLYLYNSTVRPATDSRDKYNGQSVRCITQ